MKENCKSDFPFKIVLQIFIMLIAVMSIPAVAEAPLPCVVILLEGDVILDGEPASVGTVISVELDGQSAGSNSVNIEGEYELPVTCSSGDHPNLIFYVNGIEAELVAATVLENINDGEAVRNSVDLVAISPVDGDGSGDDSGNSGSTGSSYSRTATTSDSDDEENPSASIASVSSTGVDDTSLKSVATTTQSESTEDVPAPETKTSMAAIVIGAIILICIVAIVGYKLKEN